MSQSIIEVRNIGKKYNINHHLGGYVALRDVIMSILRRPFAFLKTKVKKILNFDTKEEFWALSDVSFSVEPGEVIGIIGSNGAGKSTLLKILTGITPPTTGEIKLRGRVASLLEVGTGFHPELTGRENIFLNGAILGMHKKEIVEKFDEIVAFSGIEKFLDTPVKFYSSGMYVRLAFSVAAHLEPDILIVDEVLAVGDAEFQKKCLGKMEEVTKRSGRTILFVSHNMNAVQNLCKKTILLKNGKVQMIGETEKVITEYLSSLENNSKAVFEFAPNTDKKMAIRKATITDEHEQPATKIELGKRFGVEIEYDVNESIPGASVGIVGVDQNNNYIFNSADTENNPHFLKERPQGSYKTKFNFPGNNGVYLNHGIYFLTISLEIRGFAYDRLEMPIKIFSTKEDPDFAKNKTRAAIRFDGTWKTHDNSS